MDSSSQLLRDAHRRVSRAPRRKLKPRERARHSRNLRSFHSLYPRHLFRTTLMVGIDIFTPPVCSSVASKTARAHTDTHTHTRDVNNFPLSPEMNETRAFNSRNLAIPPLITAGNLRESKRKNLQRPHKERRGEGGDVTSLPRRIPLMFLVSVKLA